MTCSFLKSFGSLFCSTFLNLDWFDRFPRAEFWLKPLAKKIHGWCCVSRSQRRRVMSVCPTMGEAKLACTRVSTRLLRCLQLTHKSRVIPGGWVNSCSPHYFTRWCWDPWTTLAWVNHDYSSCKTVAQNLIPGTALLALPSVSYQDAA